MDAAKLKKLVAMTNFGEIEMNEEVYLEKTSHGSRRDILPFVKR